MESLVIPEINSVDHIRSVLLKKSGAVSRGLLVKWDGKYVLISKSSAFYEIDPEKYEIYSDHSEAMFQSLIHKYKRTGKFTIENYKGTKYYDYYLGRLKEDYPELMI